MGRRNLQPGKEAGFCSGARVNGLGVKLDRWAQGGEVVIQRPAMPASLARGLGRSEPGSSTQAIMGHWLAETQASSGVAQPVGPHRGCAIGWV